MFTKTLEETLMPYFPNPYDLNKVVERLVTLAETEYDTSDDSYAQGLSDGEEYAEEAREEAREEGYNAAIDDVEEFISNVRRTG